MSKRFYYASVIVFFQLVVILYLLHDTSRSQILLFTNHRLFDCQDPSGKQSDVAAAFTKIKTILQEEKSMAVKRSLVGHLKDFLRMIEPWHELPDKLDRLHENMIYESFRMKPPLEREKVDMILIVSSAPKRSDRRAAIRDTWWTACKSTKRITVKCIFLTDFVDPNSVLGASVLKESNRYGDLRFQHLTGGAEFGRRFLAHLVFAVMYFDFKYFVRMDDDYFLCIDKFLAQVPMPPKAFYHWGFVHCLPDIVRIEESIVLFSRDIVESFLGQDPNKMLCHKYADQMVALWNHELHMGPFYRHDFRLHHDPPASFSHKFINKTNICFRYIGLHGTYPKEMRKFWKNRGNKTDIVRKKKRNSTIAFEDFTYSCILPNVFNWTLFAESWREEPKLCRLNPRWAGISGDTYKGRQGG